MNWQRHEQWRKEKYQARFWFFSVVILLFLAVWPFVVIHEATGMQVIPDWMLKAACCSKHRVCFGGPVCALVMKPFQVALYTAFTPVYWLAKYTLLPLMEVLMPQVDRYGNVVRRDF
jgi:hypothetical protein